MKQIEFKTSKGTFILADIPDNRIEEMVCGQYMIDTTSPIHYKLSDITEEEASEIVEKSIHTNLYGHYVENIELNTYCYKTAIESLHSLIESLGVHLYKNPINIFTFDEGYIRYLDADLKTFYNPHIFKK